MSRSTRCSARPASSASTRSSSCSTPRRCSRTNRCPRAGASRSSATPAVPASSPPTRAPAPGSRSPSCATATQDGVAGVRRARRVGRQPGRPRRRRDSGEQYERALRVVLADDRRRRGPRDLRPAARHRRPTTSLARSRGRRPTPATKPLVACFLGRAGVPDGAARRAGRRARSRRSRSPKPPRRRSAGPPTWPTGGAVRRERCRSFHGHRRRRRTPGSSTRASRRARGPTTRRGSTPLTRPASLDCFGIPVLRRARRRRRTPQRRRRASSGFPVALKAGGADLVHKTDVGGVALGLTRCRRGARRLRRHGDAARRRDGRRDRAAHGRARRRDDRRRHPGPVVRPARAVRDGRRHCRAARGPTLRLVPLTDVDAHELVRSLRGSPLLFGYRGQPSVDVAVAGRPAAARRPLADDMPEISEMDLQPGHRVRTGRDRRRRQDAAGALPRRRCPPASAACASDRSALPS